MVAAVVIADGILSAEADEDRNAESFLSAEEDSFDLM